ncbi:MAG: rhomboid family intramembrane serine protease, partial [Candidatus Dormibacteraeota bacterium]|nr:rhomboid family intramembrane serine protease [Candidatus Dormibacteraeota bacterium]
GRSLLAGRTPTVTYVLIGTNLFIWAAGALLTLQSGSAAGLFSGDALVGLGGLYGPRVASGEWWRIITSGFLHAGLLHVGFNMLALFALGPSLENALGRLRFVVLYFTALIAGSLGALILSPGQLTVGASGAIFGLMGAFLAGRPAGFRPGQIVPWIVINLVLTVYMPGISIGGHLGGLAGGFLAGFVLFRPELQGRRMGWAVAACLALAVACFWAALLVAGHPVNTSGLQLIGRR